MNEAGQGQFKKYQRDYRIQTAEESFKKGQVTSKSPLATDKVYSIVNYDIINDGEAVHPRRGIRPSELYINSSIDTDYTPHILNNAHINLGYDAVEEDGRSYKLAVANEYHPWDTHVEGTQLWKCLSEMWVGHELYDTTFLADYDIKKGELYALNLCSTDMSESSIDSFSSDISYSKGDLARVLRHTPESYYYIVMMYISNTPSVVGSEFVEADWEEYNPRSYYHLYEASTIHEIPFTNKYNTGRPVGTFAYGNDYYNFNSYGELVRFIYDTEYSNPTHFITERLMPKDITASQAMSYGFNMLAEDPYVFTDKFKSGNIQLQGIFLYDVNNNKIITEPLLNITYRLRIFYEVSQHTTYKFIIDYREVESDSYNTIAEKEMTFTSTSELIIEDFYCPVEQAVIRVRAYKKEDGSFKEDPEKASSVGITFKAAPTGPMANKDLKNYNLSLASGMVYWKSRIWLYGLAEDPTVLFASDINDPSYFPYPNNIDIFEEPIVNVVPFNDNLLVFTKFAIHQLTLDEQGKWTKKILQGDLNFTEFDAKFVQVVKNMIFFKSGDAFYMIVPKTLSLQNELALAPVSKNIEYFLTHFKECVDQIIQTLYEYNGELTLINFYNYLNYEDIYNVYVFETESGLYINLVLLYNTVNRTWRVHTYESQEMYYPLRKDATKNCTLMAPCNIYGLEGAETLSFIGLCFLDTSKTIVEDLYIPNGTQFVCRLTPGNIYDFVDNGALQESFDAIHTFKNYQMIDSGYREQTVDYKKRYRELQFKFTNISQEKLLFSTEFILDGETRVGRYHFDTEHIVDPNDPNYGLIYISRTPIENMDAPGERVLLVRALPIDNLEVLEVPGITVLNHAPDDANIWTLDSSAFPEVAFWKARLKVSGKGYTPRFRIICRTEADYEFLGYTWVYRSMYMR